MKWHYADVVEARELMQDRLEGLVQEGVISRFYIDDARTFTSGKLPSSREDLLACLRFRTLQIYELSAEFSVSDGDKKSSYIAIFSDNAHLADFFRLYEDVLQDGNKNGQEYSGILTAGLVENNKLEYMVSCYLHHTRYADRYASITMPTIRSYEAFLRDVFPGIVKRSLEINDTQVVVSL